MLKLGYILYRGPGTNGMDEFHLTARATDELRLQATSMGLLRQDCRAIGERQAMDGHPMKS
jgi:hypothetical protein